MLGERIVTILGGDTYTRRLFRGLRALDTRNAKPPTYPALFVYNTDVINGPGEHWVCVYYITPQHIEFWDSYGNHPHYYGLKFTGCRIEYGTRKIQNPESYMCGPYCIFYALHRCRGVTLSKILSMFSDDVHSNDSIVYTFMMKHCLL